MSIHVEKLRPATIKKYRAIQDRYRVLYNEQRRRLDDVENMLCEEFFLSPGRIYIILNLNLPQVQTA